MPLFAHPGHRRSAPSGAGRGRRLTALLAVAGAAGVAGCYTYTPLYTAPPVGLYVALEINDRGRLDLEHNIGPEAAVVEGTLRSVSDSQMVVAVGEVRTIRGSRSKWDGELVTIRHTHVRAMRERRYSRGRTFALVTGLASSTLAFIVTRSLIGTGSAGSDDGPGGNGNEQ